MSPSKAAIEITAVDRFSAVFKSLEGKLSGAGDGLGKIKALAGGAFAVFTTGAVANAIGQTVTRLAELDDAAQMTGSSVERLSKIRNVADDFGVAFESITGAIAKMTKGLSGADEETKGAQAAIKALGIDTRDANGHLRDSGELFEEVSRELAKYKDDTEKAAFAQAIFGKGGEKLIPFLNDYAENMDKASTVTAEQAKAAADLQDAYTRMTAAGTRFKEQLAIETLPVLTAVVGVLSDLQKESKATGQETGVRTFAENSALALAYVVDVGRALIAFFQVSDRIIAGLAANATDYATAAGKSLIAARAAIIGNASGFAAAYDEGAAAVARINRRMEPFRDQISQIADDYTKNSLRLRLEAKLAGTDVVTSLRAIDNALTGEGTAQKGSLGGRGKALRALAADAKAAADAAKEAERIAGVIAKINEDVAKLSTDVNADARGDELTEGQKKSLEIIKQLTDAKNKFSDATKASVAAQLESILATERDSAASQARNDLYKEQIEAVDKLREAAEQETSALEERAQKAEEEAAGLGKTKGAMARESAARAERLVLMAREAGASDDAIARLERQAEAYKRLAEAAESTDVFEAGEKFAKDQKKAVEEAEKQLGDFFEDIALNGKKAFRDLETDAKRFFARLAAQLLSRYVLNIGVNGSASGGGGIGNLLGSILGGGGGGGGGGFNIGSLFGGGGSLFGGLASLAGNLGLGAAPFVAGAGPIAAGSGLAGFFGAAAGGFAGSLATLGTAISGGVAAAGGLATVLGAAVPVIGPILALLAASGVFKNEKGFKLDNAADAGGRNRTQLISSLFGNYDFAGDFDNKIVQPFIDAVAKMDQGVADAFLKSPEAVDAARARVQAIVDGEWFGANDEKQTEESIRAATLRFLKERYSAVFSTIDQDIAGQIAGFSGSTDELTAFINQAVALAPIMQEVNAKFPELNLSLSQLLKTAEQDRAALLVLVNTLPNTVKDGWAEVEAIMARANEGIAGALQRSMRASIDLVRESDKGALSLQSLASALEQSQSGFSQLANAIAGISASIAESISATNDSFLLATLDEADRYKFFQDRANNAFAGIGSLTNEDAIARAVERINADREAAFALLDPEEQRARLQEFLDGGNALNDAAQAQLRIVAETAAAAQKEFADLVSKAMLDAIAQQAAVVDKQDETTDRFGDAVTRFANSTIRLEVVNVGGTYEARAGQ